MLEFLRESLAANLADKVRPESIPQHAAQISAIPSLLV